MPSPAAPRIFISYSSKDTDIVDRLKAALTDAGVAVWLDHEQLSPGTPNWQVAVRQGISQASVVIYIASETAAVSPYVIDEISLARGKGKLVIPFWIRGDEWHDCAPLGFGLTQYTDGRGSGYAAGLAKLLAALGVSSAPVVQPVATQAAAARIRSRPRRQPYACASHPRRRASPHGWPPSASRAQARDGDEWIIPPVCLVPAGQFRLGSDKRRDKEANSDELQRRVVDLPAFEIARFPVTVAEYACFLTATQRTPPPKGQYNALLTWQDQLQRLDHPVVGVTWYDAFDYAAWLAERSGQPWRLPTEAEWEKAARSDPRDPLGASSERIYPWGDTFAAARCNTSASNLNTTTPIGWYGPDDPDPRAGRQSGASPCGAEDLAGNVWEWTATTYAADYSKSETPTPRDSTENRCLRGGSWVYYPAGARAARRDIRPRRPRQQRLRVPPRPRPPGVGLAVESRVDGLRAAQSACADWGRVWTFNRPPSSALPFAPRRPAPARRMR